ncbi:hypothetical protein K449DRAFT_386449 [Hypoxylon sp. EC38]|nr:hypothetical protein K449DRAFT_386449 [Hypoxylon sp. EC38]
MTSSYRLGSSYVKYLYSPSNSVYDFGKASFSIEGWVKTFSGGPLVGRKAHEGGSLHGGFFLYLSRNKITFVNDDGSYYNILESSDINVCDGNWHHVAAVRSGSTGSIYLDGISLPTTQKGNKEPPLSVNSVDRLTIGTVDQNGQEVQFLDGYVAEIRIWNVARTADNISQNLHRRLGPKEMNRNLVGYWPGDFGLALDFSLTRSPTSIVGTNHGAGKSPSLALPSPDSFLGLFRGVYRTHYLEPNSDSWKPSDDLTVTSQGFVVLGSDTILKDVEFDGVSLSWPSSGNPYSGRVAFATWSSNSDYWATAQERLLFEGTSDSKRYRGAIAARRVCFGTLLNIGTAQVMSCVNPRVGSPVTLDSRAIPLSDQFCKLDVGGILHADSNLALKPGSSDRPGYKMYLTTPTLGGVHQSWSFEPNGTIVLRKNSKIALSADAQTRSVVTATADANDLKQKWLMLRDSSQIYNGFSPRAVLAAIGSSGVGIRAKADGDFAQSWYIVGSSFICAFPTLALTVTGGVGTALTLEKWSPSDARQQFTFDGRRITHSISGLIVVARGGLLDGTLVLAQADTTGENTQWTLSTINHSIGIGSNASEVANKAPTPDSTFAGELHQVSQPVRRPKRQTFQDTFSNGLAVGGTTTYVVSITTSNDFGAGTDDKVEMILASRYEQRSLPPQELKTSITHPDNAFERGNRDVFVLEGLDDIGQITDVTIRFAYNTWYFVDHWKIVAMSVTNLKWHTTSLWMVRQEKGNLAPLSMDTKTTRTFSMMVYPKPNYNCTMSLCKAPAQDRIGQWAGFDHTWIEVINKTGRPVKKTYFDCAGGHGGPNSQYGLVEGVCDRNEVVRMSTGHNIDPEHPLKEAYGTARTDGFENANVRCEGRLRWDGQCHQIANRYLWTCVPPTSIDDAPLEQQPNGYGLSVFAFGKYGVGFREWCEANEFGDVAPDDYTSLYPWVQTIVGSGARSQDVVKSTADFRAAIAKVQDPKPDGKEVKAFVQNLYKKHTKDEIMKLTNLTRSQVDELLPDEGWFG